MKFVRFLYNDEVRWGILKGSDINMVTGNIDTGFLETSQLVPAAQVKLLAPCEPTKAVCIGLNYHDHAREMKLELPERPLMFLTPSSALAHPEGCIEVPALTENLHYEAELAVVIGKHAKNIKKEEAFQYVLGYTCANDVTARDLQHQDGQWTRSKSFDTFMPLGPCIETEIDPNGIGIRLYLNGELKQCSHTSNLIFKVEELIAFVSQVMTLYPGDVILTGTPAGVGSMNEGDRVTVELEGIGSLTNKVAKAF